MYYGRKNFGNSMNVGILTETTNLSKTLKGLINLFLSITKSIPIPLPITFLNFSFKKPIVLRLEFLSWYLIILTLLFTNEQ